MLYEIKNILMFMGVEWSSLARLRPLYAVPVSAKNPMNFRVPQLYNLSRAENEAEKYSAVPFKYS
ncbi:hypothetical protein NQ317_017477 [Molorchus minor]|uniref:Uncharacterized protein n=1 Tax=Molorchus minor TaxID=1323400 RepID=A0ABQ9JSQ4_9CUCU|nr:hypothetical protein NQ317_017477 [Molorchus minor]